MSTGFRPSRAQEPGTAYVPNRRRRKRFAAWVAAITVAVAALLLWANDAEHPPLPPGARADRVVVDKSARTLTLLGAGQPMRTYPVSLGGSPAGHKRREGDERTPEGRYRLDYRNPQSAFHRALHVSYPDSADAARARAEGVPPGGMIMVHGLPNGFGWMGRLHRLADWTDGCIAVTNGEMDEIWRVAADGTPIDIRP